MKQVNYVPGVIPKRRSEMAKGNSNTGTNLSKKRADSLHRDLKADHELANSPSCVSKWTGERLHNEKHSAASTSQTLGYIA